MTRALISEVHARMLWL